MKTTVAVPGPVPLLPPAAARQALDETVPAFTGESVATVK